MTTTAVSLRKDLFSRRSFTPAAAMVLLIILPIAASAQVDSALNFFPLHKSDLHQFHNHSTTSCGTSYSSYDMEQILGDTILPTGFLYKIVSSKNQTRYLRVDTATANVYQYGDNPSPHEDLMDSLRAIAGDSFVREGWKPTQCVNIDTMTLFGIPTIVKHFVASYVYGESYSLAYGFGLLQDVTYMDNACLPVLDSYYSDLVYARIGSSEFGTLMDVQEPSGMKPVDFALVQNYPNPFNPSTTIEFELPHQLPVKIVLYDLMGRELATLVDEKKDAGRYSIVWNAARYPSGIYFCRMSAGAYTATKKMTLVK